MAAEFLPEGKISRVGDGYVAFPEDIRIAAELNGRHDLPDVEWLANDIERRGQLTPVACRKDAEGYAVLVYGHSRLRAVLLLNERNPNNPRKIKFQYLKGCDEQSAMLAAIAENRFRSDVSPMDDANNIHILETRFNMSLPDIAAIYFPNDAAKGLEYVKQRRGLIELAPAAQQAVRDGSIKLTAARALAKLPQAQQVAKLNAGGGRVKVKALHKQIKAVTPAEQSNADYDKLRELAQAVTAGACVDDERSNTTEVNRLALANLISFLEETE